MDIEKIKEEIKANNPYFKNREIKDYQIFDLLQFNTEKSNCLNCNGLKSCKNNKKGFKPLIDEANNISYTKCDYYLEEIENIKRQSNLNMMYMPKKLLDAKISEFRLDTNNRVKCMKYIKNFIDALDNKKYAKGAYIGGMVGSGKTYFLSAFTNELIARGHQVTFVYFPDLINDLKDDFDKLNEKINDLKKAEILIIDDFGVGDLTKWIRDYILAPILNYRMSDMKPLFISSNITFASLDVYFKLKDDKDSIPANRILRRIDELCEDLEM